MLWAFALNVYVVVSQLDKEFKEMPAASMPSTSFVSSSSNNNNKTSYSSQLLMALGSSDINSNSKSNSNLVSVFMLFSLSI